MATYSIDIIDTTTNTLVLSVEHAERNSVRLLWEGADRKDDLAIVASTLEFSMEVGVNENEDGKFIELFTSEENRFQVLLKDEFSIVWLGYLLPDSYTEPYRSGTFYVNFYATCGLSTLKNKQLPERYYNREFSVLDFYRAILELTEAKTNNTSIELFFKPAIVNTTQESYDNIYINGANFKNDGENMSAYDILEELLQSMLCVCYQADFKWYVEGLNWRSEERVPYVRKFPQPDPRVRRAYKELDAIDEPLITVVPPYGKITVNYEREENKLPDDLINADPQWQEANPLLTKLRPKHWVYSEREEFGVMFNEAPHYNLVMRGLNNGNRWTSYRLKNPLFIKGGYLYRFTFKIKIHGVNLGENADYSVLDRALRYIVNVPGGNNLHNGTPVTGMSNRNGVNFTINDDYEGEIKDVIFVPRDGLLGFTLYTNNSSLPYQGAYVEITELSFESLKEQPDEVVEVQSVGKSTVDKEVTLPISANASALGKCFQLNKLYELDDNAVRYYEQELSISNVYEDEAHYYYVLTNEEVYLVENNFQQIYEDTTGGRIENMLRVEYNFENTEEHVLVTDKSKRYSSLFVRVNRALLEPREGWLNWRDDRYGNEVMTYEKAVASVYARMFNSPYINVQATFLGAVKFNDIINFNYIQPSNYMITNVAWNIDDGTSEVVMEAAKYGESTGLKANKLLPFVSAGEDVYQQRIGVNIIANRQINAVAFSLAGIITGYKWELLQGNGRISSAFTPTVTLTFGTDSVYQLKVTVTDEFGNEASDVVNVYYYYFTRMGFNLQVSYFNEFNYSNDDKFKVDQWFFNGNLVLGGDRLYGDTVLMLTFDYGMLLQRYKESNIRELTDAEFTQVRASSNFTVFKNGIKVSEVNLDRTNDNDKNENFDLLKRGKINISYRAGDVLRFNWFGEIRKQRAFFTGFYQLVNIEVVKGGHRVFDNLPNTQSGYHLNTVAFEQKRVISAAQNTKELFGQEAKKIE